MTPLNYNQPMNSRALNRIMLFMYLRSLMEGQANQSNPKNSTNLSASNPMRLLSSIGRGGAAGATGAGAGATSGVGAVTLGAKGVATIPAGSAVPAGYTAVGTSASGGTMVAPTGMLGAGSTTGTTAGATSTAASGSSFGSLALPLVAGGVALNNMWEGGMKDIIKGRGDRADWTNSAINAAPALPILAGFTPLAPYAALLPAANLGLRLLGKRSLGAMMESGKSEAQNFRDDFRGQLKQRGVIDNDYNITLADGSTYNIGLDGGARLKNHGKNIDGKTERQTWDVDWSNPLAKLATDRIDPFIRNSYGADDPDKKYTPGQFTGMLVNAAVSNAKNEQDVQRNIDSILGRFQSGNKESGEPGATFKPPTRAAQGQVARVSPGMYVNDRGQVSRATTSHQAMQQNYGQRQSPRGGKR